MEHNKHDTLDPHRDSVGGSVFLKWSAPTETMKPGFKVASRITQPHIYEDLKPPLQVESRAGDLKEVLNRIQAPKEWNQKGVIWRQEVSPQPSTKKDVIKLAEDLDASMKGKFAVETGICEIRDSIFEDLFDELIRHCTITCFERGLLLLRIRDEAKLSRDAFRRLYESALAYGIRKSLHSDKFMEELHSESEDLLMEIRTLEEEIKSLKESIPVKQSDIDISYKSMLERHEDDIAFQEEVKKNLLMQVESIFYMSKGKEDEE